MGARHGGSGPGAAAGTRQHPGAAFVRYALDSAAGDCVDETGQDKLSGLAHHGPFLEWMQFL